MMMMMMKMMMKMRMRMRRRLGPLLPLLRPLWPVLVGVSLGFSLSLLSVGWLEEPCPPALPGAHSPGEEQDLLPRIVPYTAARKSHNRKVYRPKYISTELGIRERLFVAVLTSKTTLGTLGVAVNRTIGHHLDALAFFTGARERRVPRGMTVVTHGDERPAWNLYRTLQHVLKQLLSDFDWFYVARDDVYTQAERLKALVGHLSMDRVLYLGARRAFSGGEGEEKEGEEGWGSYCQAGSGFLLSRALLLHLQPVLENCRNDVGSGAGLDEWLGRCIARYANTHCVEQYESVRYEHYSLDQNPDLLKEDNGRLRDVLTAHPVTEPEQMYKLHKLFTQIELQKTYKEMEKLQGEIKNISALALDGNRSATWPVGVNQPFQPHTRFEVLQWDYFTEEHIYTCADGSPKCRLHGIDRLDVADVIEVAVGELNRKYQPALRLTKQQLVNGYRRFDPTRGVEYTLDLQLEAETQNGVRRTLSKRVHLLRPLSRVEIIPMPFVTEAARVHVVVPVTFYEREQVRQFLEVFAINVFATMENAALTFLFLYEPLEAQQASRDQDIFGSIKAQIGAYERKYPAHKIPWLSVKMESLSQIKLMDVLSKKHSVDTLFFLATPETNVKPEFLNRCRMNAISDWQVFFPIRFQDYNPEVMYHNEPLPKTLDLVKEAGRFDLNSFNEACFYNSDYAAVRARMAPNVQENEELLESLDLYDVFVQHSGLHVFRAVEPMLRHRYGRRRCDPRLSEEIYGRCVRSTLESLGSRSQLAVLLFEQEQGNST